MEANPNSAASPSQASAAANNGPGPGPEYIRPELISGGNSPKSSTKPLRQEVRIAVTSSAGSIRHRPRSVVANCSAIGKPRSLTARPMSMCETRYVVTDEMRFLSSVTLGGNNIEHGCSSLKQSLACEINWLSDAIAAADADYSFPDGHCSSACNCCSSTVGLTVAHQSGK